MNDKQITYTISILQQEAAERDKRIEQLETCAMLNVETIGHVAELRRTAAEQAKCIEKLEQHLDKLGWRVDGNAELLARGITGNAISVEHLKAEDTIQSKRIEKLEAALADIARCLIDGRVSVAGIIPGELHGHRILGTESVQAMVEAYHRLKK